MYKHVFYIHAKRLIFIRSFIHILLLDTGSLKTHKHENTQKLKPRAYRVQKMHDDANGKNITNCKLSWQMITK